MSRTHHPIRLLAGFAGLALALSLAPVRAQQTVLEVIPLKYRNAEEVIAVLRPLMPPAATLTGMNNKLIVRTTPANLAEVKQILATLDAAPRRLMISVRQDAELERRTRGGQVSGRVEIGDNAAIRVPGTPTPPGATVRVEGVQGKVYSSEAQNTDRIAQQVQVVEGAQAYIRVGQSVPVSTAQVTEGAGGRRTLRTTEFRDVDTGFYVRPRVSGDQVTLEIFSAADRLRSPATAAADIQRVRTVVSGRLGEWIEIAGIAQQGSRADAGLLSRSSDAARDDRRVLLKVDEIQ
jgi:type II secretory pathway component HofQ